MSMLKYITTSFMAADVFAYVRIGTMERRSSPREERLSIVLSSLGSCIRCVPGEERQRQDMFLAKSVSVRTRSRHVYVRCDR